MKSILSQSRRRLLLAAPDNPLGIQATKARIGGFEEIPFRKAAKGGRYENYDEVQLNGSWMKSNTT